MKDMGSTEEMYGSQRISSKIVKDKGLVGKKLVIKGTSIELDEGENRIVLTFNEIKEDMKLNKTNARLLAKELGDDYELWVGHAISLHIVDTTWAGEKTDGVRVGVVE